MNTNKKQYDIIGDIHGYAETLERMLHRLDYTKNGGSCYRHPERTAVFVGDLIDRGPENFRTLEIVKTMVEEGAALIVMGNHEYNALCYHSRHKKDGTPLRPHNRKNFIQHKEVLKEIKERGNDGEKQWTEYLEWFRRMPLFLENDGFRVVHACWDAWGLDYVRRNNICDHRGRLTDEFLMESSRQGTDAFEMIEILLKGEEVWLPDGHPGLTDKDGTRRKKMRVKWWMSREQREALKTYDQLVRADGRILENVVGLPVPEKILTELRSRLPKSNNPGTNKDEPEPPVFFGHYWFSGEPEPLTPTAVCLDYSVAKGGKLVCYRWDGERTLDKSKLVSV
jgi:hypothetical protein